MSKGKQINIWQYTKKQTIIMAHAGLAAGLLYSVGDMFIDLATIGWNHGTNLAFLAIPIMPLYFAAFGFATGLVGAFLYNVLGSQRFFNLHL